MLPIPARNGSAATGPAKRAITHARPPNMAVATIARSRALTFAPTGVWPCVGAGTVGGCALTARQGCQR